MTGRHSLDRRPVLYGGRRLSDPQVRALEAAADFALLYWHGRYSGHAAESVEALNRQWLVLIVDDGAACRATITKRGSDVLDAIRRAST